MKTNSAALLEEAAAYHHFVSSELAVAREVRDESRIEELGRRLERAVRVAREQLGPGDLRAYERAIGPCAVLRGASPHRVAGEAGNDL